MTLLDFSIWNIPGFPWFEYRRREDEPGIGPSRFHDLFGSHPVSRARDRFRRYALVELDQHKRSAHAIFKGSQPLMKGPKGDPIRLDRPSDEGQRDALKTLWQVIAVIATVVAIAFLLYVLILVYGVMQRL
ncbi:hypothetical protein HJB79_26620 [Rhizobium lentis]|uniref:hypothetical protein n=2 Tax=Rhizobium lentis TaxID=1138194 RepID=UPI001C83D327|nr:hypothetical protein [Rhizobium lentis]MBX5142298.1 hypothetical protein [Rhizobium lentis]